MEVLSEIPGHSVAHPSIMVDPAATSDAACPLLKLDSAGSLRGQKVAVVMVMVTDVCIEECARMACECSILKSKGVEAFSLGVVDKSDQQMLAFSQTFKPKLGRYAALWGLWGAAAPSDLQAPPASEM